MHNGRTTALHMVYNQSFVLNINSAFSFPTIEPLPSWMLVRLFSMIAHARTIGSDFCAVASILNNGTIIPGKEIVIPIDGVRVA